MKKSNAGKQGDSIRSDCYVEVEKISGQGIVLNIESKVASLFGSSIRSLLNDVCTTLGITSIKITVKDYGALPFVIAARLECAIKSLVPNNSSTYVRFDTPPKHNNHAKDARRRSRLYLPGNEPKYFLNAGLHKPDAIILDLEDSVVPDEKVAARFLVRNALLNVDFKMCERMVRINRGTMGLEDLEAVIPYSVNSILIPKCETVEDVKSVVIQIERVKKKFNITDPIYLIPIIESAKGVMNAYSIAQASTEICALAIGLEDYCADIGVERTFEGRESLFARQMVVNSAKATDVQALASVYSDVSDDHGLMQTVMDAKSIGFDGMGCIHPRQIKTIHDGFLPTDYELKHAQQIIHAFENAKMNGKGITTLGSKMIDAPVVKQSQKIIESAIESGMLSSDWLTSTAL